LDAFKQVTLDEDLDNDGQPSPGDTLHYHIVLINSGNAPASEVVFDDTPPDNTSLVAYTVQTSQGVIVQGNGPSENAVTVAVGIVSPHTTVTIDFKVKITSPLPALVTTITNQGVFNSLELPGLLSDDPNTISVDDPTITQVTAEPMLGVYKSETLSQDVNGDGLPSPNDMLLYIIQVVNQGNGPATGIVVDDTPGVNTTLVVGSVQTSQGSVVSGNTAGDSAVSVNVGNLEGQVSTVEVSFRVRIVDPLPGGVTQVSNQALVSSNELPGVLSDDADTPVLGDPTITPIAAVPILRVTKI
jgi:uncharacterized repeat protein (TIGR01451 family)